MTVLEDAVRSRSAPSIPARSTSRAGRRFLAHRGAAGASITLVVFFAIVWIGPWFLPSPTALDLDNTLASPSAAHWFGTDALGRDVMSRVLVAGRSSLGIAVAVATAASMIGAAVGVVAGYRGRLLDGVLMGVTDLWLVLPALPVLAVAASIGEVDLPGPLPTVDLSSSVGVALVLTLLLWSVTARVVRATARELREREFVTAARACGARTTTIVRRHVLPHCLGPIMVEAALLGAGTILLESTLSFLGFGVQPPTPTWGNLLDGALGNLQHAWWLAVFPGLAIFVSVLSMYLISDGLRDIFDPRRGR
jgi:peptide/nickel transport system permease protein